MTRAWLSSFFWNFLLTWELLLSWLYGLIPLSIIDGILVERKFRWFQLSRVVCFEPWAYCSAKLGDTYVKLQPNWGGLNYNVCSIVLCLLCVIFLYIPCDLVGIFLIFFRSFHWLHFPKLGDFWLCWVPVAAPVICRPWLCRWLSCLWLHCAHQSLSCWSSCGFGVSLIACDST